MADPPPLHEPEHRSRTNRDAGTRISSDCGAVYILLAEKNSLSHKSERTVFL